MTGWRWVGFVGVALGLGWSMAVGAPPADGLIGADAALRQWQEQPDEPEAQASAPVADPLRQDLETFAEAWPAMSAEDAAPGWLALYDRWVKERANANDDEWGGMGFDPYGRSFQGPGAEGAAEFTDVVSAIPGPASWPILARLVEDRSTDEPTPSERALRLLTAYLAGDQKSFETEAGAAVAFAERVDNYYGINLLQTLAPLTDGGAGGDDLEAFRKLIQRARENPDNFWRFEVPDLVTLYGEDEARALLGTIVLLKVDTIEIEVGDATRALAAEVALDNIDALPVPRWELVASIDEAGVALFEAMEARAEQETPAATPQPADAGLLNRIKDMTLGGFDLYSGYGDPFLGQGNGFSSETWQKSQARVVYLLGLIVLDRVDEATALVESHYSSASEPVSIPYGLRETLARMGARRPVFDFAEQMVDRVDGAAFWPLYIRLGAQLEQSDRVLAKAEAALDRAEGARRELLLDHLVSARFAADDVEGGVAALRQLIESDPEGDEALTGYARLARIGHLMDHEAWLNEGIGRSLAALAEPLPRNQRHDWERQSARDTVVRVLIERGRFRDAERLLVDAAGHTIRAYEREALSQGHGDFDEMTDAMVGLAVFYGEAERWDDVLTLFEDSPYWGASDLKPVYREEASFSEKPLAVYAARALAHAGRNDDALRVVNAALNAEPGEDALYPLLIELDPDGASVRLDDLFARDQFEERPLIWKARLQLDAGEPDAAHETIRRAISIDPSDGEQGPGDRMRAYAVLAEILRAQGDTETAQIMEGAVRAIRMSEDADRFDRAGLLSRAVAMYKESLTHFADAYCIQSRLAIQLANLGRYDEAAAHYERAYELMPDSFGRVESHCFGCEGAFTGERAQSIAEQTFDRLVLAQPFKPQVHYLRGYLKSSQGDSQAALENYREAVRLDPDYLNAWANLRGLARSMQIDRDERDRATLAIFRLDPLSRHTSANLQEVRDVAEAWRAIAAAQPLRIEPPASLLPLPASAAWVAERSDAQEIAWRLERHHRHETLPTPGTFVARHSITQAANLVASLQP